jgi:hypothetical protein
MSTVDNLPYVEAELLYLVRTGETPRYYFYDPVPGEPPRTEPVLEARPMRIRDMRPIQAEIALDQYGFALVEQRTSVCDFWDDETVRRDYYPELERFVGSLTGARRVHAYDHVCRRRVPGAPSRGYNIRQPVTQVHVDRYTRSIGPSFFWRSMLATRAQRVRQMFGEDADELVRGRIQVVTVWRAMNGPVQDMPLALCDARTVDPGDFVPAELVFRDRIAEHESISFNPRHRWYYAPEIRTDEAFLITCSDTKAEACPRGTPHAAFTDPATPPEVTLRQSIEVRLLVFYEA